MNLPDLTGSQGRRRAREGFARNQDAKPGARRRDLSSRRRPGHAGPPESSAHAGAAAQSGLKASTRRLLSFFVCAFEYARVKNSCLQGCNLASRNSGGVPSAH